MEKKSIVGWLSRHWFGLGIVLLVVLKHSILAEQPFVARSSNPHDDTLFLLQARYLLSGEWLGPFNQLTLLRGPFYPLWISFVYLLGIPLIHANDFLYLGACFLVVRALVPVVAHRPLLFFVFVFLYYAPHSYDYATISHAFRMQIYPSLVLLVFGAALGLSIRLTTRVGSPFGWSFLLGVSFSCFWYTREEGVWMVPALLLLVCLVCLVLLKNGSLFYMLRGCGYLAVIPVGVFALCTGGLLSLNSAYYGTALTLDVKAEEFRRAYDALLQIKADEPVRRVPVTRRTLQTLYELSPKMRELQPYLKRAADSLPFGGELPAAIFIFSFRDATAAAGYYEQGPAAVLSFYDGLGREIEELCQDRHIPCGRLFLSMVPLWRSEFTEKLPGAFFNQFYLMVRFPEFNVRPDRFFSYGDQRFLYNSGRLTHSFPRVSKSGQWDAQFPEHVREFKLGLIRDIGNTFQSLRMILFFAALLLWVWFVLSDLKKREINLLNGFALSLIAGLSALAAALAIIEVTSFHMLFRPRHGGFPVISLFIVCVLSEWYRRSFAKNPWD